MVLDSAAGPELVLTLAWPDGLLTEPDVEELADGWVAMLTGFTAHARHGTDGGHTPSDFPLAELDQDDLDEFEAMAARITEGN